MNSIRRPRNWFERALLDSTSLIPLNTSRRHDPCVRDVVRDVGRPSGKPSFTRSGCRNPERIQPRAIGRLVRPQRECHDCPAVAQLRDHRSLARFGDAIATIQVGSCTMGSIWWCDECGQRMRPKHSRGQERLPTTMPRSAGPEGPSRSARPDARDCSAAFRSECQTHARQHYFRGVCSIAVDAGA